MRGITDQPYVQSPIELKTYKFADSGLSHFDASSQSFSQESATNDTSGSFNSTSIPHPISSNATSLTSSPFDAATMSDANVAAPMPSRPAPVPSSSLQIPLARDNSIIVPPRSSTTDRPLLSPISD